MNRQLAKASGLQVALAIIAALMPMPLKRCIYRFVFGWSIHRDVQVGFTYILVDRLVLERGVRISHGNVIKGCSLVHLKADAQIGAFNWISAPPLGGATANTRLTLERNPQLLMGAGSAIVNRHIIDCSDTVSLSDRSVLAGHRSQVLTHYFDIGVSRGLTAPVEIGESSLVFTAVVLLAGAKVPSRSVVAAGAVVTEDLGDELKLYGGVPAKALKDIPADSAYFQRN